MAPPAQVPGMWYYCDPAGAYYPYVATCPVAWREVAAQPQPAPAQTLPVVPVLPGGGIGFGFGFGRHGGERFRDER